MSLTILVSRDLSHVGIVRWFLDPKVSISYATGPLTKMSWHEFRAVGWDWMQRHFEEFTRIRVTEETATAVFGPGEERAFLKNHFAVRIRMEESGELTLIPQAFRKRALEGLESLGKETRRTIPAKGPPFSFWRAFDEVLANCTG